MADLIERDAVLEIAMQYCPDDDGSCSKADADIRELLDEIENMPSVNRWIPCSEQMPDRFDTVLLAILSKNGYGEPAYYVTIGGLKHGNEFESYTGEITECETVTHWMPLPEPPESDVQDCIENLPITYWMPLPGPQKEVEQDEQA